MLKDRQKTILDAVIQEYIRTACPVASRDLAVSLRPKLSPATIRNEMLQLDELGYLRQPHTSAGRIPTDTGYRFFVDNLIPEFALTRMEAELLEKVYRISEAEEFVREFSRMTAEFCRAFSAVLLEDEDICYESGFSKIFQEPEFAEPGTAVPFGSLIDLLDSRVRAISGEFEIGEDRIFIGEENPIREARPYTMVVTKWKHPRGFSGFLTVVAPKRTDYARHKVMVRVIKERSS